MVVVLQLARQWRQIALLDIPRVVVGEAVDPDDGVALREQVLGQVRADGTGGACDKTGRPKEIVAQHWPGDQFALPECWNDRHQSLSDGDRFGLGTS